MFTTLNSRIGRTLVAAVLPFSMTLGLAAHTFAQTELAPATPTQQNQLARKYSITMNGTTITVRFDRIDGSTVNGEVLIGDTECPFDAQFDGQTLKGTFVYGGNDCPFTATVQGTVIYLDFAGTHLVLQQVA